MIRKIKRLKDYERVRALHKLGDIERLMKMVEAEAISGLYRVLTVSTAEGSPLLEFRGHIFEPIYEYFDTTCRVTAHMPDGTSEVLFDETDQNVGPYHNITVITGSKQAVTDYIRELGKMRVRVSVMS